jgi:hypothetical protein
MKKLFLSIALPSLALSVVAQAPILDSGDIGAIGSTYYMATDTLIDPTMDEGPSGAGVTWDYRSLGWQSIDTVKFVSPASTGHGADFPTADLAISDPSGAGAVFLDNTTTNLEVLGAAGDPFGVGVSMLLHFDPTQTLAEFPLTYGDAFLDTLGIYYADTTSLIAGVDSARYTSTVYRDINVDAWGTLMLGGGNYNCLRMRQIERSVDMIEIHTLFGWVPVSNTDVTDTSFVWWGETRGYLLCQVNISGGAVSSIDYLDPNSVGVNDPHLLNYQVQVYPNPASGKVMVDVADRNAASLDLLDLSGKRVKSVSLVGLSTEADFSELPKGVYVWQVRDAQGNRLATGNLALTR